MPIDINRRNAIAASFNQYPTVLEQFATNNCFLLYPMTKQERAPNDEEIQKIMQICMAQFCVRLIQTRSRGASLALEEFAKQAVERYHAYHRSLLGGLVIEAPTSYRMALQSVEQGMAGIIFHALGAEHAMTQAAYDKYVELKEECELNDRPMPADVKEPQNFDEGGFWHDVFLALTMNQRRQHPRWIEPVQEIVLNHLDEFKMALDPQ